MTAAEIIRAAMELVPEEREEVAKTLLASLPDFAVHGGLDPAWDSEIAARVDEVRNGKVVGLSREELRSFLQDRRALRSE